MIINLGGSNWRIENRSASCVIFFLGLGWGCLPPPLSTARSLEQATFNFYLSRVLVSWWPKQHINKSRIYRTIAPSFRGSLRRTTLSSRRLYFLFFSRCLMMMSRPSRSLMPARLSSTPCRPVPSARVASWSSRAAPPRCERVLFSFSPGQR